MQLFPVPKSSIRQETSVFDSYDIKSLRVRFEFVIFTYFKMTNLECLFFNCFIKWNQKLLILKFCHFEASEDIMTKWPKFIPQTLHAKIIKYWKARWSGNSLSLSHSCPHFYFINWRLRPNILTVCVLKCYNIIQVWFLNTYSITHRISLIFSRVRSVTASCSIRIFFVHISNFLSSLKGFLIVGSLRLKQNKVKEQTDKVKIHRYKKSEQTNKQTMYVN